MSLEKIAALQEEFRAVHAKMASDGKALIEQAFKDFFAANPEVASIYWTQYTPHWNDGDICRFRVHDFDVDPAPGIDPDVAYAKVSGFECAIVNSELFQIALGDHKSITATASGLSIKKCDHD